MGKESKQKESKQKESSKQKKDLSIKSKVILIGVVALLISIFVGVIGQYYTGKVQNLYSMQNQVKSIETLLLEGIIKEKEFLASGDVSLKTEVVSIFDEMIDILETDIMLSPEVNDEISAHLEEVLSGIKQYKSNFESIDALNTAKGLTDQDGFKGQLLSDVDAINELIAKVPGDAPETVELKAWEALNYPQDEEAKADFPLVTIEGKDYYASSFEYSLIDKPQRDALAIKINGINNNIDTYVVTNIVFSGQNGDYTLNYDSQESFEDDWSFPEEGAVQGIAMGDNNGAFALLFDVDYSLQDSWGYVSLSLNISDKFLVKEYDKVSYDILLPVESNGGIVTAHYTKADLVGSVPHGRLFGQISTLEDLYFVEEFIHTYVIDPDMVLMTDYTGQINDLYTNIYDTLNLTMLTDQEKTEYEGLLLSKQEAMNNLFASDQELTALRLENSDLQSSIESSSKAVELAAKDLVLASNSNDTRNRIIILLISSVILLLIVIWIISSIQKSFKGFKEVLKENSQGNLSTRAYAGGPSEFREFAKYLNSFLEQLSQIISGISEVSTNVEESNMIVAKDMENLIGDNNKDVNNKSIMVMNDLVINMNDRVQMQQSSTESALAGLEEISASSDQILDNIDSTMNLSKESVTKTNTGYKSLEKIRDGVDGISANINKTNGEINDLSTNSKDIIGILNAIKNISSQTNLLALNASIEAARAGEEGRGFTIVAEEVRKLAEQTDGEAAKIEVIINAISLNINEVLSSTEGVKTSINDLVSIIELFDTIFKEIIATIENSDQSVTIVSETIKEQLLAVSSIASNVSEISEEAGEIGHLTSSTSSIMESITEVLHENYTKLQAVAEQAIKLNEEVEFFK